MLGAALALVPQSAASVPTFKGKLTGGGRVAFEVKRNERGVRKVVDWRWHDLKITCEDRPGKTFGHDGRFRSYPMKIVDRRFGAQLATNNAPHNVVSVQGEFPVDWRHAQGTLQLTGDTSWGHTCSSGEVSWTADRI